MANNETSIPREIAENTGPIPRQNQQERSTWNSPERLYLLHNYQQEQESSQDANNIQEQLRSQRHVSFAPSDEASINTSNSTIDSDSTDHLLLQNRDDQGDNPLADRNVIEVQNDQPLLQIRDAPPPADRYRQAMEYAQQIISQELLRGALSDRHSRLNRPIHRLIDHIMQQFELNAQQRDYTARALNVGDGWNVIQDARIELQRESSRNAKYECSEPP